MVTIYNKLRQTVSVTLTDSATGLTVEFKIGPLGSLGPIDKSRITQLTEQLAQKGHLAVRDSQ